MSLTLEELAIHLPASIGIFEKYGLDYYRNGSQTLREACRMREISFTEVDSELCALKETVVSLPFTLEDLGIERLLDHINGQHHLHEEQLLENIHSEIQLLQYTTHDREAMILQGLESVFFELRQQLTNHCEKEDKLLFPFIRRIALQHRNRATRSSLRHQSMIADTIQMLRAEHGEIIHHLEAVRQSAENFLIGDDASPEYAALMDKMRLFEQELHLHLHMENNILFPKLVAIEKELLKH